MRRVVIVGAGFGGLQAARALSGNRFDVLLLDLQAYHLFQPLLYQVATAALDPERIAIPVNTIVAGWSGVTFRQTDVHGLEIAQRCLLARDGAIHFDYLILTAGAARNFFGLESIKQQAHDIKHLWEAVALRDHILNVLEKAAHEPDRAARSALLTIVIVGGGPTGVELAGALTDLMRGPFRSEYPELRSERIRLVLTEATERLLPDFPEKLQRYAARRLRTLGVEMRLGTPVVDFGPGGVFLKDGSLIPARTLVWAAGVRAAPLADAISAPPARSGRIPVQLDLTVSGYPDVYVVGDMAYLEQNGKALPMTAPVALQQGRYAGRAIIARERGQVLPPFRYRDMGSMATIGRYHAVASIGGLQCTGFPGWLIWLFLHLCYLITFGSRLAALLDWGRDYVVVNRQVRRRQHGSLPRQ